MRLIIASIGFVFTLVGCSLSHVDLIRSDDLKLVEELPEALRIKTSVYEDDGNLVVLGAAKAGPLDTSRIPGHVDLAVLSLEGEELATVKANFRSLPSWRHGPKPVAFRVELPGLPPKGSTVKVVYHLAPH